MSINHLANCNIFVDGGNFLGKAEEVMLPEITWKQSEVTALGLLGTPEFPSGIETMEATIKWNSLYPDAIAKFANPFGAIQLRVRGNLEGYDSTGRTTQKPVVDIMTVKPKANKHGEFKAHERVTSDLTVSVSYYKLKIDQDVIHEIDIVANICKVNGVDILATYRQNLGI